MPYMFDVSHLHMWKFVPSGLNDDSGLTRYLQIISQNSWRLFDLDGKQGLQN